MLFSICYDQKIQYLISYGNQLFTQKPNQNIIIKRLPLWYSLSIISRQYTAVDSSTHDQAVELSIKKMGSIGGLNIWPSLIYKKRL